ARKRLPRRDGQARVAVQAARVHLPELRDLRRRGIGVGLRAAGRGAQAQPQGAVVELDGAAARRRGRPRRGDPHAPAHLGGERPRGRLRRPARGLQGVQGPLPGRQARGRAVPAEAEPEARRRRAVPAHRAAAVQPDVQDVHGGGGGERRHRVPAPGDRAGDLRELPERAAEHPAEGAVRDRADRQGVPQRDHAGELHLPHARVRADGDAVLRRARHRHGALRVLEGGADAVAQRARARPGAPRVPPARGARAGALRPRRVRHPVRLRRLVRLPGGGGAAQPGRLRPHPAPAVLGQEARVLRPAAEQALRALRDRDERGRGPRDARRARERVPRGERRGRGRGARGARPPPRAGADQGGGVRAHQEGRAARDGPPPRRRPAPPLRRGLRRDGEHRQALPPAGRGGDAVLRHGGRAEHGRPDGHDPRPRHAAAGARRRRPGRRVRPGADRLV
ncbi:MAG: Glycyl-tRNA synthetase, partial [uncultured Gemmatimonadaceae bacterium]